MPEEYWTGPREQPRRYRVRVTPDGVRPEPGGGAEGLVYRARVVDPLRDDHGAEVALNLLLNARPGDLDEIARRLDVIAQVDDPGVMRPMGAFLGTALTDDARPDDGDFEVCWVVAEWIEGHRLGEDDDDAEPSTALRVTSAVARALHALHTTELPDAPTGILHRDVKSSNVRVANDGRVVLVDFGLARPAGADGSVVGTPGWLAPEVAAGHPGDRPADVYGVGAIAHHLIHGEPPRRDGRIVAAERLEASLRSHGVPLAAEIAAHLARPLAIDERDRPDDLSKWADDLDQLRCGVRPSAPPTTRRLIVAVAPLLVAGAISAAWVADGDSDRGRSSPAAVDDRTTTTERPWRCASEPGLPDDGVGVAIRRRYDELGRCAGAVTPFGEAMVLQLLDRDGEPDGVVMASPSTEAVVLTDAQFASYREIAGRANPWNAAKYGGYPTSVATAEGGVIRIELSGGGLLLGRRADTQSFWIPHQAIAAWEATGGLTGRLGLPTSNPFFISGGMRLEFERGFLDAAIAGERDPSADFVPISATVDDVQVLTDPAAPLEPLGDVRDRVLRQTGGTAWYVDDRGVRHWIRNGSTWGCLQANERLVPGDVQGFAVASLELGPPAECPA